MINPFLTTDEFRSWFSKEKTQLISHRLHLQKSSPQNPRENSFKSIRHLMSALPQPSKLIVETDVRRVAKSPYTIECGIFISHDSVVKDREGYLVDLERESIETIQTIKLDAEESVPSFSGYMIQIYEIAKEFKHQVLVNIEAKTEDCMQEMVEESLKIASDIPSFTHFVRLIPSSFNKLNMVDFHLNFPDRPAMLLIDDQEIKTREWTQKQRLITSSEIPSIGLSVNAMLAPELIDNAGELLTQLIEYKKGLTVFTVNDADTFTTIKKKCHQFGLPLYGVFSDEYLPLLTTVYAHH